MRDSRNASCGRAAVAHLPFRAAGEPAGFHDLGYAVPLCTVPAAAQDRALLREHVQELGVPVLAGHTVRGVRQQDDLVVVEAETAEGSATFAARWVVGCDGPSSIVRKSAGIGFPVRRHDAGGRGDVRLADPPRPPGADLNRATVRCPGGARRRAVPGLARSTTTIFRPRTTRSPSRTAGEHDPGGGHRLSACTTRGI